jgi:hypothetical protein
VTGEGGHCSFCGATRGPFATVEGLFTVWICIPCLEVRQAEPDTRLGLHDRPSPYLPMTPAEMRESLELLPSWVLAQKAAANRQLIAVMRHCATDVTARRQRCEARADKQLWSKRPEAAGPPLPDRPVARELPAWDDRS